MCIFLRFFKNLNFLVGVIVFLVLILALIIPYRFLVKESRFSVEVSCKAVNIDDKKCSFSCSLKPVSEFNYDNLNLRFIVFHSIWTSIYDRTFSTNNSSKIIFDLNLPVRNYQYPVSIAIWDDEGDVGSFDRFYTLYC